MNKRLRRLKISRHATLLFAAIAILVFGAASAIAQETATSTSVASSTPSEATSSVPDASSSAPTLFSTDQAATATDASSSSAELLGLATTSQTTNIPTPPVATTTVPLLCTTAYVADLYDTPSGHLDPGYTLSTTTGPGLLATKIGTQAWTDCRDEDGTRYEIKISPQEYAALAQPDADMPVETATTSAKIEVSPPGSQAPASQSATSADGIAATTTAVTPAAAEPGNATTTPAAATSTAPVNQPPATSTPISLPTDPTGSAESTSTATTSLGAL